MRTPFAIATTLLILVADFFCSAALGTNLTWYVIGGTAAWAAYDSAQIELTKYRSGISYGPVVLFIGFVMLWIVAFPWYLSVRYRITHGLAERKQPAVLA